MNNTETPKMSPPPPQQEDRVNDLGWVSRGPARRRRKETDAWLEGFLLKDGEESGLPPDPKEPPPLPPPPEQEPDIERPGRGAPERGVRVPGGG